MKPRILSIIKHPRKAAAVAGLSLARKATNIQLRDARLLKQGVGEARAQIIELKKALSGPLSRLKRERLSSELEKLRELADLQSQWGLEIHGYALKKRRFARKAAKFIAGKPVQKL